MKYPPDDEVTRLNARANTLYRMLQFLRRHEGECIGDHKDWIAGIDALLDGESFDAWNKRYEPK